MAKIFLDLLNVGVKLLFVYWVLLQYHYIIFYDVIR